MASAEKWIPKTAGLQSERFMVKAALTRKFTPIPLTQSRLEVLMSAMAEKQLMMLKFVDQTPVLAGCSGCNLKFFVPKGLMKDPFQANNYLLSKFYRHVCTGEGPRTGGTQSSMLRTSGEVARGCAQEEGNDVDVKPRSADQIKCWEQL